MTAALVSVFSLIKMLEELLPILSIVCNLKKIKILEWPLYAVFPKDPLFSVINFLIALIRLLLCFCSHAHTVIMLIDLTFHSKSTSRLVFQCCMTLWQLSSVAWHYLLLFYACSLRFKQLPQKYNLWLFKIDVEMSLNIFVSCTECFQNLLYCVI